ncbi:MAG TPA: hypothetical protein VGW10_03455 [Solirubrobacteraceae bacterium]|nr:hypothetical protein [Solirubrobacteraceae bacterium]
MRSTWPATALAVAFLALPAGASADTLTCELTGEFHGVTPGAPLVGGAGTYLFRTYNTYANPLQSLPTTCAYNGHPPVASTIRSRGSFVNTICGTFAVAGDPATGATQIEVGSAGVVVNQMTYRANVSGQLFVDRVNGASEGSDADGALAALPRGSCTSTTGAAAFEAAGAFTIAWNAP